MPLFGPPNIDQLEAKRDAQGLIKALVYKDASIRQAAAEALAPLKDPAAVEPLAALLQDESAAVRRAAAGALAERGGFRVVEPLVVALQNSDADVRAVAANAVYRRLMTDADAETRRATATALGRIKDPEGVGPLLKAIKDADDIVRVAAIKALQAIGDTQAVLPLVLIVAREGSRARTTGKSDAATERAASQALEVICDERAIEPLLGALAGDDPEVREVAAKRLARIGSPAVREILAALLVDDDVSIRRAAARGLAELDWQPPADETGARYWAAIREWRRCAEAGAAAIPILISSFDGVDAMGRVDILAALAELDWQPEEANAMAAYYWASRDHWEKCTEMGEPAIEALDSLLLTAPRWRTRVEAAAALAAMDQPRPEHFPQLNAVREALALLEAEGDEADKRGLLEAFLVEKGLFDPEAEAAEFCKCGYPAMKASSGGTAQPIVDLLGFERGAGDVTTYYCPSCDARRATVVG